MKIVILVHFVVLTINGIAYAGCPEFVDFMSAARSNQTISIKSTSIEAIIEDYDEKNPRSTIYLGGYSFYVKGSKAEILTKLSCK